MQAGLITFAVILMALGMVPTMAGGLGTPKALAMEIATVLVIALVEPTARAGGGMSDFLWFLADAQWLFSSGGFGKTHSSVFGTGECRGSGEGFNIGYGNGYDHGGLSGSSWGYGVGYE